MLPKQCLEKAASYSSAMTERKMRMWAPKSLYQVGWTPCIAPLKVSLVLNHCFSLVFPLFKGPILPVPFCLGSCHVWFVWTALRDSRLDHMVCKSGHSPSPLFCRRMRYWRNILWTRMNIENPLDESSQGQTPIQKNHRASWLAQYEHI